MRTRCTPIGHVMPRALAAVLVASWSPRADERREADHFVVVNGVRLHYVDWGGKGESLLFLTPLGGDLLEQFASLAPQFTDRFRVLGLTRRGQGQSDKPDSEYAIDTLVLDHSRRYSCRS